MTGFLSVDVDGVPLGKDQAHATGGEEPKVWSVKLTDWPALIVVGLAEKYAAIIAPIGSFGMEIECDAGVVMSVPVVPT